MCIAVIKPKGVKMPNQPTLRNCFDSNPHGAGFMYSNGNELVIKKGYMTFNDFYSALTKENISDDKLVFLHFRIATHGLRDGGNTHPFPVTTNIQELRSVNAKFKGYGLIHNGVMHYASEKFAQHDPTNIISDTMLFSMILAESIGQILNKKVNDLKDNIVEKLIAYNILSHEDRAIDYIEQALSWNKVAIMDVQENFVKYGHWIEHEGMFYSNEDYEGDRWSYYGGWDSWNCGSIFYTNRAKNGDGIYVPCCSCETLHLKSKLKDTIYGKACEKCIRDFELVKCKECDFYASKEDLNEDGICADCQLDYRCDKCKKKVSYLRTFGSNFYCNECYEKVFEEENTYSY